MTRGRVMRNVLDEKAALHITSRRYRDLPGNGSGVGLLKLRAVKGVAAASVGESHDRLEGGGPRAGVDDRRAGNGLVGISVENRSLQHDAGGAQVLVESEGSGAKIRKCGAGEVTARLRAHGGWAGKGPL